MSEDLEFEKLMAERQRNELNSVLKELAESLSSSKEDGELLEAIRALSINIGKLLNKPEKEQGLGNDVVLFNAVEELKKYIKASQVKKQWDISFERNEMGYLKSPIILTQKQ